METQERTTAMPVLQVLASAAGIGLPLMSLVLFAHVPVGRYWSLNIGGRPGLGVARKLSPGLSGDGVQVIEIGGSELVWWLHGYTEEK